MEFNDNVATHCQYLNLNDINTAIAPVNLSNFTELKTILISSNKGELYNSVKNIHNSNIAIHCTVETVKEHELSTVYSNVSKLTIEPGLDEMNRLISYHLNFSSLRYLHFAKGCGKHIGGLTLGENVKELEELIVEDDCFTMLAENQQFMCKGLQHLRAIRIGENSFPYIAKFTVIGMFEEYFEYILYVELPSFYSYPLYSISLFHEFFTILNLISFDRMPYAQSDFHR